jgi:hypothetical protein
MQSKVEQLLKEEEYKRGERGNWDAYRQDVNSFVLPRKAWITTVKVNGARLQDDFLYDSRATLALKEAACGFHSKLTNPAQRWFESRTQNEKKMQSGHVQRYFKEVDDVQFDVLRSTNFDPTLIEFYTDDLSVGVATILTEEDHKKHVRYSSIPIEQVCWELDDRGELCKIYRSFKWSAYKCQQRWGSKITPEMKKAIEEEKGQTKFEIMHYVGLRNVRDVQKKDNANMEWESLWIAKKEQLELGNSGFVDMPYDITRFWVSADDDDGGYSPAMDVLAAIKTVNAQARTITRSGQKAVDPAYAMPSRFWIAPLNGNPSAMNYYDASKYKMEQFGRLPGGENLKQGVELMAIQQELIDRGFFLPLFRALSDVHKQMTVPEVQQRIAEGLGLIGPVVGRMTNTIQSVLLRTYGILDRRLLFPEPPKEIQGEELAITFNSPLARAQRQSELQGTQAWVMFLMQLAEGGMPYVLDGVDGDRVRNVTRDLFSADPTMERDDEDTKAIRANRAKLQEQQQKLAMAQAAAGSAKDVATAHKTTKEAGKV